MLNLAISDSDTLYWESTWLNQWHPNKRKVMDSLSTVKMAISPIKMCKLKARTTTQMADKLQGRTANTTDTQTVASQMSTITQLTEQVSILQPAHNEIDSKQQQHTFPILMQSCWKPWPDIMTTLCSWQCGWFLHAQHSTQANWEPPILSSLPCLDEPVLNQESDDKQCGHWLGKNQLIQSE